jgi:UDP-N-acetylmuramoyl-tripeptide--D-alanyl-D-alanine ligase
MTILAVILALAASLSPLLTLAHLWQIKEWRVDRLREHLRSEGIVRQLFGVTRPLTLLILLPLLLLHAVQQEIWVVGTLGILAAVTILQFALDRQPLPLRTAKAIALTTGALVITLVTALFAQGNSAEASVLLVLLPILQPIALGLSWAIFLPVDRLLKRRIMERARKLRESHHELIVIGITGSVGKTTTKELLWHLLRHENARATPAYVNTEMGVSQWLIRELKNSAPPRTLIVEMGAYRRGEIALLCELTRPTIGIITFIGTQHIALFKSQEALLEAKAELFDALPEDGVAILNSDSPLSDTLKHRAYCRTVTVSTGGPSTLQATDVEETATGVRFRVNSTMFSVPLHGTHNVTNILLAIAAAESLGLKRNDIAQSLTTFRPPEHTFAVRRNGTVTLLDDTHNASPSSFKAAIGWARTQPAEEKVLLTSGLIELGEAEDRTHTELGVESVNVFDRVIFVHPRHARSFSRGWGKDVELLRKNTPHASPNALLVCIGRMPEETLRRLLP